jgi:MFS family permease
MVNNQNEVVALDEDANKGLKQSDDFEKFEIMKQTDNDISIVDNIIDEIEFTGYHVFLFILMNIYIGGEGFIMIGNSLLVPVLSQLWGLTEFEKGYLGGSIFIGFTIGAFFSGFISDTFGRRSAFICGLFISLLGTIIIIFEMNYFILGLSNILNGLGIGISIPSVFSLCSELTGGKVRNVVINISFMSFTAGEIIGCYIARSEEIYIPENNNWKSLLFLRAIGVLYYNILVHIILTNDIGII